MEDLLRRQLGLQNLKAIGGLASGGCISNGQSYQTERGKIFVKSNESQEVSSYRGKLKLHGDDVFSCRQK